MSAAVVFPGAMYLESGLTSATVLFTNVAFDEEVCVMFLFSLVTVV